MVAQVGIKVPLEKLTEAYLYELVLDPLEEAKLPPSPPSSDRVREAFLKKMGVLDLTYAPQKEFRKPG